MKLRYLRLHDLKALVPNVYFWSFWGHWALYLHVILRFSQDFVDSQNLKLFDIL